MCGRYSIIPKSKQGSERVSKLLEKYKAETRYNAAPSQRLPVITNDKPNEIQFFSWGLLPHWSKDADYKNKPINARAETLTEKPTFRQLIGRRRCLVPADGFYEWQVKGKSKAPFRITLKDEGIFTFAGLWDEWQDKETGEVLDSFTIITCEPNKLMAEFHDRMPVILHPNEENLWLANASDKDHLALLKPFPANEMKAYRVSSLVNSPANETPRVLEPEAPGLFD